MFERLSWEQFLECSTSCLRVQRAESGRGALGERRLVGTTSGAGGPQAEAEQDGLALWAECGSVPSVLQRRTDSARWEP